MAKYKLFESAYVGDTYVRADARTPAIIEVDEEVEPSRTWQPIDKAAESAQRKLLEQDYDTLPEPVRKSHPNKEKWVEAQRPKSEEDTAKATAKPAVKVITEQESPTEDEKPKTTHVIAKPRGGDKPGDKASPL